MGIRIRRNGEVEKPDFAKAIPGAEELAGTLKDTFGAFRNGLGIAEATSSATCEGCGAALGGRRHETVRCDYCDRQTQLP
ncbi:hypothetical protein [Bifidobacterium samirii]|uniref:Uncharacterized protein n=1 Tax=Bifidobacterium samirii TaxID=2306974 RepID=A0A430FGV6_9BIFI|nr:hypothetical protein [Bifidobacterium samirii]RSX52103.1 hypothetical protein D2E24_1832 [Bifidobacterium samirii]